LAVAIGDTGEGSLGSSLINGGFCSVGQIEGSIRVFFLAKRAVRFMPLPIPFNY